MYDIRVGPIALIFHLMKASAGNHIKADSYAGVMLRSVNSDDNSNSSPTFRVFPRLQELTS